MKNDEILKYCENFYEIINFEPMEDDLITPKMIKLYREYIFKPLELTDERIMDIKNLDKAMKKYINDYIFRKDMQKHVKNIKISRDVKDVIKLVIDKIIDFFVNYTEYTTRIVYISRWI